MSKKIINIGTSTNDGLGDSLRAGAQKINENFSELYDSLAYTLPTASQTELGGVKIGTGLAILNGVLSTVYTLPTATALTLGGVKVGAGLAISNGVLSTNYTLPVATSSVLGGVKIGNGLAILDGVLSTTYSLPTATELALGGVKIDNATIQINNGVISIKEIDGGNASSVF